MVKLSKSGILTILMVMLFMGLSLQLRCQDMQEGFDLLNNQQFAEAEEFFEIILETYPDNRTARLCHGRAVGLGGNPVASISVFNALLQDYPDDQEIHINLAESYLWAKQNKKAVITYQSVVDSNPEKPLPRVGLSVAHYLLGQNKKSQHQISQAMSLVTDQTDPNIAMGVRMQSLQSLLWQNEFTQVEAQRSQYLEDELITAQMSNTIIARSALRQKNHKNSLWKYNQLINENSKSSEAWSGRVQSLMAMDSLSAAYKTILSGLTYIPKDSALESFSSQIERQWTPSLDMHYWYNSDSGNSMAQNASISTIIPTSERLATTAHYRYRGSMQDDGVSTADLHHIALGINYRLIRHLTITGQVGLQVTRFDVPSTGKSPFISAAIALKRKKKNSEFNLGYRSGLQDYNVALLSESITQNDIYLSYNYTALSGIGVYAKVDYNIYSDRNRSTFGYLSIYQRVKRIPFVKSGINFQYLGFSMERPTFYFSPDHFYAIEAFVDIVRSDDMVIDKGVTYLLTIAGGSQIINEIANDNIFDNKTYRLYASLGYKFASGFKISTYGLQSNVASTTIAGFTYSEIGLKANMPLAKRPLFTID